MSTCLRCVHFLQGGVNPSSMSPGHAKRADGVGLCRRYPPRWAQDTTDEGGSFDFPAIHQDHRCGEFQPRISI
ncbi:hypothetical protein N6H05_08375 [Sphingobium sp. WTD-1]|uniref:hypothetical protein n=1 Tax=Sphingobium sp. WTD-1 TaxID=2979467 RepID=UPI0024DE045D|nr:hypothetical protein [Sphingobium sp. WTD-1]WIA57797.1 hypothetical protein N6H05_08375 [Sphingobium sp. WTD-1]